MHPCRETPRSAPAFLAGGPARTTSLRSDQVLAARARRRLPHTRGGLRDAQPALAALSGVALLLLGGCASAIAQDDPSPQEQPQDPGPEGGDSVEVRRAEGQGEFLPLTFHKGEFQRRDGEFLKLEARRGDDVRFVPAKGVIEGDEVVVFVTQVDPSRDEYVYLLESTGGAPRMIHPRMGRVHLSGETGGERRIRPLPANEVMTGDEDEPEGWQVTGGGWAQYLLVATPSPRDESSAGSLGSLEMFLEPPPYATGKAAKAGRLVDAITVRWQGTPD